MIYVAPKSSKAENRLANAMCNDNRMEVQQFKEDALFAVSISGDYCCWIKHYNDPHFDYLHTLP